MKAREWLCFIKIEMKKYWFYPSHDKLPLFWKCALVEYFVPWRHWICDIWYNRYTLMPNNTITMDSSVSDLCWIFLTQSSSGILQDQCVYSWSGILHHLMAPSTGYQLCEPPTEPQSVLTSNRRKRKGKGNVKENLISFYCFLPNYNIMPYGVCVMVLDLENAGGAKTEEDGRG